jgi:hypothetical protein
MLQFQALEETCLENPRNSVLKTRAHQETSLLIQLVGGQWGLHQGSQPTERRRHL